MATATLPRRALLARVSSWSHKKLSIEASKVEPPAHGRARVESSESLSLSDGDSLGKTRKAALHNLSLSSGGERGNEPCQAYRQDLIQRADVTYVNLGTMFGSPSVEWASLRLMPNMGRSLRSSLRPGKPVTWRRKAIRYSAELSKLRQRRDV